MVVRSPSSAATAREVEDVVAPRGRGRSPARVRFAQSSAGGSPAGTARRNAIIARAPVLLEQRRSR